VRRVVCEVTEGRAALRAGFVLFWPRRRVSCGEWRGKPRVEGPPGRPWPKLPSGSNARQWRICAMVLLDAAVCAVETGPRMVCESV
jgi:hypothetical protein